MEIERVNDTTIRFFITYKDIEERGFEREEIWYNRERGEELFYDMMNEASDRDDFELDGPLWIQVHAHDKGLEILVTRGQISDGNMKLEIPVKEEEIEEGNTELDELNKQVDSQYDQLEIIIGFREFEDVISLSHSVQPEFLANSLYHYEGRYYLHIHFNNDHYTEDEQDNLLSRMLEFGYESELTIHRLKEYGKEIAVTNGLSIIKQAF
ncbi:MULTISPECIES: adaptor protein MecA [Bacillaceae]|uniref:Adapter protein MecA n=1 Tax=Alkalicoccobacillus plakortidis TaxID=444060 RepID=A0A9D5DTC0_9BACI|nr:MULTISPECIES: adaptor protein MecA [Bacillaceae]KQL57660.1 adapter protein MecA [Alkalicoccobacillus plakortidis]